MKTPADLFSLSGRTAVVVGGTGVLCGEMAEGLAAAGAAVAIVGRDAAKAQPRLDRIAASGGRAEFFSCSKRLGAWISWSMAPVSIHPLHFWTLRRRNLTGS
jgi:NAD(P)-dependent dehydrogenase (short-subunit alcohol dehydrogenase family)